MHFDSLSDFILMGGHALYVWLAYGATILVLLGSYVSVRAARKSVVSELKWSADEPAIEANEEENKI